MNKSNIEPLKPFSCSVQETSEGEVTKVFVNFGIVVCTASNSLDNVFIPKTPSKKELKFFAEEKMDGFNIIDTTAKGCICLKIILKDINEVLKEYETEWEYSLFSKNTVAFKDYIKKYFTEDYTSEYITSNLDLLDLANPKLGMDNTTLVPFTAIIDPASENYDKAIEDIQREIAYEKLLFKNWSPDLSSFYTEADPNNPLADRYDFVFKPRKLLNSYVMSPIVNSSCPILDVIVEFVESTEDTKEKEEKLDKYNFIINNEKLIPIAYLDSSQKIQLEQVIDFDYVFNFPFYFDSRNLKQFKK